MSFSMCKRSSLEYIVLVFVYLELCDLFAFSVNPDSPGDLKEAFNIADIKSQVNFIFFLLTFYGQ